ncbi:hypothetical protein ACEPPN_013100 [Leptodophora sp. 'Broadleaf-Isolate-01']
MKLLHFTLCLILPILALANTKTSNPTCKIDEHCSLNGLCHHGSCICDPGWKSFDCGALDLIPAPLKNGYNKTDTGISSWGSKIIHRTPDSETFDLFLAEFTHDCGLDYWSPYSRIVHATSSTGPAGPYEFAAEVVRTFSHNPTVVYSHTDRKYLLYYIGCPHTVPDTCVPPSFTCGPGNTINGESELINLATAENFLGPYRKVQKDPLFENRNEDPFLWRDKRGNFHMLLHSLEDGGGFGDGPKVGRHAFSKTLEGPWTFNAKTLAFDTTVIFEDGSFVDYFRRERPQLFFSEDGEMTPLYLTTGVQEVGKEGSYTVIQPLGGAAYYERQLYEHHLEP